MELVGTPSALLVPGWGGSGPGHWQTIWANRNRGGRKIHHVNPRSLDREDWIAPIRHAMRSADRDLLLVAHSLGCHAVSWWAEADAAAATRVKAAMLVAPPDLESDACCLRELLHFSGAKPRRLPFPSILVASKNDPHASFEASARLAAAWGAALIDAGRTGHINVESGHGPWPEGERYLAAFLAELADPPIGVTGSIAIQHSAPAA
jgi:predicted alpha/beta hydrolase family esterase